MIDWLYETCNLLSLKEAIHVVVCAMQLSGHHVTSPTILVRSTIVSWSKKRSESKLKMKFVCRSMNSWGRNWKILNWYGMNVKLILYDFQTLIQRCGQWFIWLRTTESPPSIKSCNNIAITSSLHICIVDILTVFYQAIDKDKGKKAKKGKRKGGKKKGKKGKKGKDLTPDRYKFVSYFGTFPIIVSCVAVMPWFIVL